MNIDLSVICSALLLAVWATALLIAVIRGKRGEQ